MSDRIERVILVGIDGLQLCQVERFADGGALPNFQALLAQGSSGELLPELPAWTPTNWGTIATGALPGSTMLAGWHRRQDDDPEGKWDVSTFSSRACPTDTIWDAARRAGLKTLSVFHPLTWPPRSNGGMVVAPLYSGPGVIPLDISKGRVWTTKPDQIDRAHGIALSPSDGRLLASVQVEPSAIELAKEFNFGDKPDHAREATSPGTSVPITLAFDPSSASAEVIRADGQALCTVQQGQWSEWVTLDFGPRGRGTVRFYLLSCSQDSPFGFTLCHSSVYPDRGFTSPPGLAEELIRNVGPFLASPTAVPGPEGVASLLSEYEYQGLWMAKTARYLLDTQGWNLYYQHFHIIDSASHRWLGQADPEGGGYDPVQADHFVGLVRKAYQVSDKVVGAFREMADDKTVVIVISDHGNVPNKWAVDYARVLESAGLLSYNEDGTDWQHTQAFMIPQRISDVYVNLKGRYPVGTVEPADYEKVQEQIIDALLDLRNPDGKRVVAYALKKRDAQLVGYYGPEAGDVVFVFNAFHGRAKLPKGEPVRRADGGANHGPQIATTRTGFSSNMAAAVIAGPGIRRGYRRDPETQGLWKLTQIAPTIAHMLGFAPPKDACGGVMYDLFE